MDHWFLPFVWRSILCLRYYLNHIIKLRFIFIFNDIIRDISFVILPGGWLLSLSFWFSKFFLSIFISRLYKVLNFLKAKQRDYFSSLLVFRLTSSRNLDLSLLFFYLLKWDLRWFFSLILNSRAEFFKPSNFCFKS